MSFVLLAAVIGTPHSAHSGGGFAAVHRNRYSCRGTISESFSSFESQTIKFRSIDTFYCVLIYCPPGPAGIFINDFTDFSSSIIKLEKVLHMGDFNLRIDDVSCNAAVEHLTITDAFN